MRKAVTSKIGDTIYKEGACAHRVRFEKVIIDIEDGICRLENLHFAMCKCKCMCMYIFVHFSYLQLLRAVVLVLLCFLQHSNLCRVY